MRADIQSKGMSVHRLAIRLFTVVLAVLYFWLLRFLVQDIQTIPGPDFTSIDLILSLLLAVAGLLIYFIPTIAYPKMQWLVKQYREAYERFLFPVCEYPIRTGPRRFLFWTRRTVNKIVVPMERGDQEEVYTCPSCGSNLFENCPACQKVRHTLLPHCAHCGAEKAVPER